MLKRPAWLLALCFSFRLLAHDVPTVQLGIALQPDVTWRLDVVLDLQHLPVVSAEPEAAGPASIPGLTPALAKRYEPFIRMFLSRSILSFDGLRVLPRAVEVLADSDADTSPHLRLTGPVPPGARELTFSSGIEAAVWIVHPRLPGGANAEPQFLQGKETSRPIPLGAREITQTRGEVFRRFIGLGFTHILPEGTDHILFVLGIFLLSVRLKPMLIQVTAFTVAHTITLALTMYGVVSLSPSIVEPLIALSIVYVAVENVLTDKLTAWRPVVVFCFGLLHGMGFAGVLREVGLPRDRFLTALFSFNLGVECGQLTVILAAFLVLGLPFRGKPWYRKRVVIPASVSIAAVGLFWFVQRAFFGGGGS
jgi:hypothetical protein